MYLTKEKLIKVSMISVIVICASLTMMIILFGVKQFKLGSQLASMNQVSNLSHLLVRQQANLLSMLLVNNSKPEQLTENLDQFAKETFVLDASIYNNTGELLAKTTNSNNLRESLGLDGDVNQGNTQQIVEPIYSANGIEGFLRVTFDSKYGTQTQSKINQLFHQLYGELIIVFLVGALLASSVHYFLSHYRRAYRNKQREKPFKPVIKAASKQYHRKRRRL